MVFYALLYEPVFQAVVMKRRFVKRWMVRSLLADLLHDDRGSQAYIASILLSQSIVQATAC